MLTVAVRFHFVYWHPAPDLFYTSDADAREL